MLRVRGTGGTVLLPGDIEHAGETHLVRSVVDLAADVILAPHHGSRTSSGPGLVEAVRPSLVIYAAARDNRWGFPAPSVAARWAGAGAEGLQTGEEGAIVVDVGLAPGDIVIRRERAMRRRYWHWAAGGG